MERSFGSTLSLGDDAHEFTVGADLAVNFRFAPHTLNPRAKPQRGHFQDQGIAGNDWPPKTRFFDAGEQHEFLIAIGNLAQRQNGAALGEGFDDQHSGHDRGAGKVPLKKRFVVADLLDTDDALERFYLDDSIDQQKRIAMRQKLLYAFSVENGFHVR